MPTNSKVAARLFRPKKWNLDVKSGECMLVEFENHANEDGKKRRDIAYQCSFVERVEIQNIKGLVKSGKLVSIMWPTNLVVAEEKRIKPELPTATLQKETVRILAVGTWAAMKKKCREDGVVESGKSKRAPGESGPSCKRRRTNDACGSDGDSDSDYNPEKERASKVSKKSEDVSCEPKPVKDFQMPSKSIVNAALRMSCDSEDESQVSDEEHASGAKTVGDAAASQRAAATEKIIVDQRMTDDLSEPDEEIPQDGAGEQGASNELSGALVQVAKDNVTAQNGAPTFAHNHDMRRGVLESRGEIAKAKKKADELEDENRKLRRELEEMRNARVVCRSDSSNSDMQSTEGSQSDENDEANNQRDDPVDSTDGPFGNNRKDESYPLPTGTARLGSARKSWWNQRKTLSQTVNFMLDKMFSVEELTTSSLFGGRGEGSRPSLDQYRLNAILNFCFAKYGQEPSWRGDFAIGARAHMKYLRKKKRNLATIRRYNNLAATQNQMQEKNSQNNRLRMDEPPAVLPVKTTAVPNDVRRNDKDC